METLGPLKGVYRDSIGVILGLYRENGKENGNYYSILGFYWDNGKENYPEPQTLNPKKPSTLNPKPST